MSLAPADDADTQSGVPYIDENGTTQFKDNVTIVDHLSQITLDSGWYLFTGTLIPDIQYAVPITINGDVHIILADYCVTILGGPIDVTAPNSLTIYAQSTDIERIGSLTVYSRLYNACIGSLSICGDITINGGYITTANAHMNAGIGSGSGYSGGSVTINGGIVYARGGAYGAGIGGGAGTYLDRITINGGTVTAIGGSGNSGAAGIGGGYGVQESGGTITITGGTIKAFGGSSSAGIGSAGNQSFCGTITISGGDVEATGGHYGNSSGAGIGGGSCIYNWLSVVYGGDSGDILIYGENTKVTAKSGDGISPDIGAGTDGLGHYGQTDNILVMLSEGNLLGTAGKIGNTVKFTANPASANAVEAELPAPFNMTIDLLTGLGTGAEAKMMSAFTTTGSADDFVFGLNGYDNSPIVKTGGELMTSGASVDFMRPHYTVTITIVGSGSVEVSDGTGSYGTLSSSGEVYVPTNVADVVLTAAPSVRGTVEWSGEAFGTNLQYNLIMGSDRSVTAIFGPAAQADLNITATSDSGSVISPRGAVAVQAGTDKTFDFYAKSGYVITSVKIDGVPLFNGKVSSGQYTFFGVLADHSISVTSVAEKVAPPGTLGVPDVPGKSEYIITATSDKGATISPNGTFNVLGGTDMTFRFTAGAGNVITSVLIDGDQLFNGNVNSGQYTFYNVQSDHIITIASAVATRSDSSDVDSGGTSGIGLLAIGLLILLIIAALLALFLLRIRSGLFISVANNGEVISGVGVTYSVEKGGKIRGGTVYTNSKGKCRVRAKRDSVVTITAAVKDGRTVSGLPIVVAMENRKEYLELSLM
ncbi:hypothetical protein Mpt1_c06700 [Candidatus Methanoplasma termitum]|uniref:Bacterial repeat domain-containing protein n=1 Tax=Candidatus Methanoplasma termitum TaxID=1577791 RepID=A0A0A7LBN4_9ARCH|nr:hypothetical protein [Candidatus Methanoplasma termitum]AIZ56555.1 hypothetical protein Mpt1_c06700 [Candidatus Methanoplasma termitum]